MKGVLTVARKEFARFFGDRRMVLTALILPGLMIYVLYTVMGSALTDMMEADEDYTPVAYVIAAPDSLAPALEAVGLNLGVEPVSPDDVRADITAQAVDLLIVFPENFDETVAALGAADSDSSDRPAVPNVEIYYNSASTESSALHGRVTALLEAYKTSLLPELFDVNREGVTYDQVSEKDAVGSLLASLLPLLLLVFLFSGCTALAPEAIAGEKERGTIATILVTPLRRGALALGKLVSLAIIAFLAGLSSLLGTILSLPKMFGGGGDMPDMNIYGIGDYLTLAAVVLSTVLLFVALISILSAFAKSVKEAATMVSPLMIVVMVVGVTAMFGGGAQTDRVYYLIPTYNSVQAMVGIFSLSYDPINILLTVLSNLAYAALGGFLLTRMFHSEKIIFSK
ncbi:MAG: ABC transporter permease [Oscillospiraceae bacterium]|jgi:sodium transport system permease protein|nr:ABC transporter permease [Oscillospiraceae bacterium]